jgi:hypothetical protein
VSTASIGPQSDSQPIPAIKPPRSTKDPVVKAKVLLKRANGETKYSISKDLGMSHNTVDVILKEANFDGQVETGRNLCSTLIPESIRVVKHRLAQNSETAAFKLLEGIGVLGKDAKPSVQGEQFQLNQAISIMFKPQSTDTKQVSETPAITVTAEQATHNCPPQDTQPDSTSK